MHAAFARAVLSPVLRCCDVRSARRLEQTLRKETVSTDRDDKGFLLGNVVFLEGPIQGIDSFAELAISHIYAVGGVSALRKFLDAAAANGYITPEQEVEAIEFLNDPRLD
jgi:hypothetical protein